ncbi:unnamed protein product [Adineta ricciae]|uniref:Invertebrate defensins family profile domain-containing protein n=1 Tax=Adineta ricciae TaxID=249248 RepID=A0A815PXL5_ADIRI|nr:unnamed protein product [Adineta ricciae]CAF1455656.1 unnamed protein product [Adineta ricciae]
MHIQTFIAILLVVIISLTSGATINNIGDETEVLPLRVTCDIASISAFGVSFGDSLCAANCIRLGYKGGYCNSQKVCNCRR